MRYESSLIGRFSFAVIGRLAELPTLAAWSMTTTEPERRAEIRRDPSGGPAGGPGGARGRQRSLLAGATDGNERLTVQAGAVLFVLLAVLGVTIVRIGQLTWLHLFLGLLLIGPLALKLASTGYRFARYYTGAPAYRRKGPPPAALRVMAPLLVVDTLVIFASGVALLFAGPSSRDTLMPIHKVSFIVWLALASLHVLGHLGELAQRPGRAPLDAPPMSSRRPARAPTRARPPRGEPARRRLDARAAAARQHPGARLALIASLLAGLVLALVLIPEFAPWVEHAAHR